MENPRIKIATSKGDMVAELFEEHAPNTVANIITLAESGYYTDMGFHRILKGFMAQGGCPNTKPEKMDSQEQVARVTLLPKSFTLH